MSANSIRQCPERLLGSSSPASLAIVLLAAGGSRRMGQPKQLLRYQGQTLVRRSAELVLACDWPPALAPHLWVVIGAGAEQIRPELADLALTLVENRAWQMGLSSSLQVGLTTALATEPNLQACLILLADQPCIPTSHLQALVAGYVQPRVLCERGREAHCVGLPPSFTEMPSADRAPTIVATQYAAGSGLRLGVPALFDRCWFSELLKLEGDRGAQLLLQLLLQQHADQVLGISCPAAAIDVDTPEDYVILLTRKSVV